MRNSGAERGPPVAAPPLGSRTPGSQPQGDRSVEGQPQPDVLPLEGLPPPLFACTPSRLTAWLDCSKRYRMTYVDRPPPPKGPPWAHNWLGATVHNALKACVTGSSEQRTGAAAA